MRKYASEKAERLRRFFDGIHSIEVILATEATNKRAEIIATVAKGETVKVHADHEQMNAAIDLAISRAERTIVKYKEKLREHRGPSAGDGHSTLDRSGETLENYQDIVDKREFEE
jgi:ribosomal subunit interface protein